MKATLRKIAQEAGIAESTVSRALSGQPTVAEETRARVLAIAERLGYSRPLRVPPGLPERRGLVGVVVAALHNSFYPYLVDRIHDELDGLGYDMILIIDELSSSNQSRKVQALIETSLDGIVFATATIHSPTVDLLVARDVPLVLAIRSNKRGNVDVIESDNRMAGAEATRHLTELGHRRIGFLLGPRQTSTSTDRFAGCVHELQAAGVSPGDCPVIWSSYSHDSGYSGLVRFMALPNPPTAIVGGNDVIAIGALDACRKLSIAVPDDVSIVGVDDIPMASWSMISLTTIRQSIGQIGSLAARRVVTRIEGRGEDRPSHDILPTSLVQRSTTAPPRPERRAPRRADAAAHRP